MADIVKYYPSDDIIAFPSSNSIDEGKLTLEENMRSIVTRVTNRNYVLTEDSFKVTIKSNKITLSTGQANIQGYHVITSKTLEVEPPIMTGTGIIFGMKLTYDNSDHIRGDVEDGIYPRFEGLWVGYFSPGTVDKDLLIIGTLDYDGTTISNYVRNPELEHRLNADDISVNVTGPKPPQDILTLQEFIDNMKDWYVSKYGDFIVTGGPVGDGKLKLKKSYTEDLYSVEINSGTNSNDGGELISSVNGTMSSSRTIDTYIRSSDNTSKNSGLLIDVVNKTGTKDTYNSEVSINNSGVFSIIHKSLKNNVNYVQSINFSQNVLSILGGGSEISLQAYSTSVNNSMKAILGKDSFTLRSTKSAKGHEFGYDLAGTTPYYLIGGLKLVGNNSIVSNTGTDINISPSITVPTIGTNTINLVGSTYTSTLTNLNTILEQSNSNGIVNRITGDGGFRTANRVISTSDMTESIGSETNYSELRQSTLTLKNTSGTSYLRFNGDSNNVYFSHSQNSTVLNLTGDLTVSNDIRASRVYNAVYNDYAEWYLRDNKDEEILPGDVIELNPISKKYRKSTSNNSNLVIGVCSDSYGHIVGGDILDNMEDNINKYIPVGISGRVYVNTKDTSIRAGDLLTSTENGLAMKSAEVSAGTIIGKSLEDYNESSSVLMQIMLR